MYICMHVVLVFIYHVINCKYDIQRKLFGANTHTHTKSKINKRIKIIRLKNL